MTAQIDEAQLREIGWAASPGPGPGRMQNVSTDIPGWGGMTWAERILHRGMYGFDDRGTLFLHDHSLRDPAVRQAVLGAALHEDQGRRYAIPEGPLPGSDDRLRRLLDNHRNWEPMRARDDSIVWRGGDGSLLLTCPEGWGIPGHTEEGPIYCEFGEGGSLCPWEGYGEQPSWSARPDWGAAPGTDGQPGELASHWKLESVREFHGIREELYRDSRHILGGFITQTSDGNRVIRWHRKETRSRLVYTAHPEAGWEISMTSRGVTRMVAIASRRNGETERIGSVMNFDVAHVAVHDYVRRESRRRSDGEEGTE